MRIFDSASFTVDLTEINELCTELTVQGSAYCVWPNREGEGFELAVAAPTLNQYGCRAGGLSLSWPATASTRAVILQSEGISVLIRKENDRSGRHEEIRIFADNSECVRFRFTGPPGEFKVSELTENKPHESTEALIPIDLRSVPKQFQLGLIGPEGECNLPGNEGFKALIPLAYEILNIFPMTKHPHVLHLFGYAAGHDRGYPDYSPSVTWGGKAAFSEVLADLKSMGFKISLYMNARVMDASIQGAYPLLRESILRDFRGKACSEEYFGRRFLVMNPESEAWRSELLLQAMKLKEMGADMIQLDQIAGRAAPVAPGSPWGEGYADLIRTIQKESLEVWIQGVSDFYRADSFEMTWKEVEILDEGILRGGNPLGKTDLSLLKALKERDSFSGTLLTPWDKRDIIDNSQLPFRLDLMDKKGLLPLYGPGYIQRLKGFSQLI